MEYAKLQVLKNYPYMQQFLNRCRTENVSEALMAIDRQKTVLSDVQAVLKNQANRSLFKENVDYEKLDQMLTFTLEGLMNARFEDASFHPDMLYEETCSYLNMLKSLSYR